MVKSSFTLNIKGTPILEKNIQAFRDGYRYIINTGGSRSSKSTSILQSIIILCYETPNTCVSIVTNSLKSMRMNGAVYDDFFKILKSHNIYNQKLHNKSDCKYTFPNGSNVEFFGVDDDQKVRGPSRDILFVNEANRIDFDEFNQLMMRTKRFAFLDRNPSEVGWIDNLVKEPKAINIHCFVGWTKVLTNNGYKRIDSIKVGELVMTRNGYRKVLETHHQGETIVKTYLIDGKEITCTPKHKFYTKEYGMKEIKSLIHRKITFLIYKEKEMLWEEKELVITELPLQSMMGNHTTSIHTLELDYIDINGNVKEVQYQKDSTSITSMEINSTMILPIYSVYPTKNTIVSTGQKNQKIKELKLAKQKSVENISQREKRKSQKQLLELECVKLVGENLIEQREFHNKNTAAQGVNHELIKENIIKEKVYDLTVEDDHEFIVEGVLVSNSTYKDNTFLAPAQVAEIENFINTDPNYYRIYALGLSPTDNLRIYNHFKKFTEITEEVLDVVYGLDFGMRDPTALVKCSKTQLGWYIEEVCYEIGWTQTDLINFLKMNLFDNKTIYCDSSRPDMIEDLQRNGFNTVKSDKAIKAGIDSIRSQQIYIHNDSTNIWNEYYRYNWKENSVGETPIDLNNHSLDAIRYAIHSYKKVGMFNPDDYGIY